MYGIRYYYLIIYTDMFLVLLLSGLMKLMFCRGKQNQMPLDRFEHLDPVYRASTSSSSQRPETWMNHDVISIKVSCVITRYRETCFHLSSEVEVRQSVTQQSRAVLSELNQQVYAGYWSHCIWKQRWSSQGECIPWL